MKNRLPQSADTTIPDSFQREHYTQHHVAHMLGETFGCEVTEQCFWMLYTSGRILPGVPLMGVIAEPLMVWPRADIDAWFAAGCPQNEELVARERRVLESLSAACEAEGFQLPTFEPEHPAAFN